MPAAVRKGRPADVYHPGQVGNSVQTNFDFLKKLFGPTHQELRNGLWNCKTEAELRNLLGDHGVTVQPPTRIMVVDIENARSKVWGKDIDTASEDWYALILPPVPRRKQNDEYADMQAWSAAWYHASNDGYGM